MLRCIVHPLDCQESSETELTAHFCFVFPSTQARSQFSSLNLQNSSFDHLPKMRYYTLG